MAHTADAGGLPAGRWTGRTSILDPFKPYLHGRWAEGCTAARRLFEELRERGHPGGESMVKKYVQRHHHGVGADHCGTRRISTS
ncbi:hypothetical protein ACWZEH_02350 [Streptomyces sp. QTS137]